MFEQKDYLSAKQEDYHFLPENFHKVFRFYVYHHNNSH